MTDLMNLPGTDLVFGLGIEDTCVYPADRTRPPLDEHELTGHTQNWAADLSLASGLGARTLRYGASWPLTHPSPGEFRWDHLDRVVNRAEDLGLLLILDLVHYGTPRWLPQAFADHGYPAAIAEFATAVLERYQGRLFGLTPLNEPLTTASFCGLRGVWPPNLTGWDGWVKVVVPIAQGIARTIAAARRIAPELTVVHVEAATLATPADPAAAEQAQLLTAIGWLPTDLALGRVTPDHPMWGWLVTHGAPPGDLEWLIDHAQPPDLIGVNYYPDLTPRQIHSAPGGPLQVAHNRWDEGLTQAVRGFAHRYGLPLAITETSIEGDDQLRTRWLVDSINACRELRTQGVDLRGYTWWPLFDFVDWSWASGGDNVEEFAVATVAADGSLRIAPAAPLGSPDAGVGPFLRRMGLVRLDDHPAGVLVRRPTAAAAGFQQIASGGSVP